MIRVVIAEDQVMVREGIKHIIERDPEINVVGCAGNGEEAFELCKKFQPDLALMDIVMPECDGIEGARLIKERFPAIKVIILTTFNDDENIVKALNNGADGYMLKDIYPDELIMAVKSAAMGLGIMHKNILFNMAKQINKSSKISIIPKHKTEIKLTEGEMMVIRLVVDGKDNKEIASALYMSEGSVKNTISGILKKLNVNDRTQLAVFAVDLRERCQ